MKNYFLTRLFYFFVILSMLLSAVGTPMQTVLAAPENAALQLDGTNDHTLFSLNLDASNFTPETLVNHTSEGATMSTGTSGFDGKGGRPSRIYPDLAKGMDLGDGKTLANVNMMWSLGNTSTGVISANFEEAVSGGNHTAWGLSANDNYRTGFMTTQASTPTPAAVSGLLGHWRFDESSWVGDCSTADILDSSGNNHHGTACIDGDAPFPVPGKFGNAGRFDGIDQYANMGPGFNFTSSFTAAMWIALDDYDRCGPTGKSQHIIGTHHLATPAGNGRGWGIYWDCDGLAWELTNSDGSAVGSYGYVQPSPFPVNGSWHHAALVYDSTVPSATLYWDGVPIYSESSAANVPSILFNNGEPLTINGLPYAPSSGAPGKIDDTRVYNRVLSAAEIQTLVGNQPPVTFGDVLTDHWAWAYIETLFNAGVTSGCSTLPMMYCPATTVTRDQMAIFLLRGKHGSSYTPPPAAGVFQDVPTNYWAADWIEQLAVEGITSGCNVSPKQYCPTLPVTRDQMAVFLLKAKHGSSYGLPSASGVFGDVPLDYWAAAWIEQLAAEGITTGCGNGNYCPATPVTRDQMAVFLVRTFNMPTP